MDLDLVDKSKKSIKDAKKGIFTYFAPKSVKAGATLGLLGTGAYLGGRAIINKLKNKNDSKK